MQDGFGVVCCDGAQIIVEIGARWAEHSTRGFHRGIVPPVGKQMVTSGVVRPLRGGGEAVCGSERRFP